MAGVYPRQTIYYPKHIGGPVLVFRLGDNYFLRKSLDLRPTTEDELVPIRVSHPDTQLVPVMPAIAKFYRLGEYGDNAKEAQQEVYEAYKRSELGWKK